jgi:hypothetical protein
MKSFALGLGFKTHRADKYPLLAALNKTVEVQASKEELLAYHRKMFESAFACCCAPRPAMP